MTDNRTTNYEKLFGTPERVAVTFATINEWQVQQIRLSPKPSESTEIRLEGKRGDYEVYTPERTCNLIEDGDSLHCSNCGGAAEKQSWTYWNYCPNCRAKVIGGDTR